MLLLSLIVALFVETESLNLSFRPATRDDVSFCRRTLIQKAMNPLVQRENLIVATLDDEVVGFGQLRSLDDEYAELASLFVLPEYRHQGIGSQLVDRLLDKDQNLHEKICLLTLRPTASFYESHGFEIVERPVKPLAFEFAAGTVVSKILGNDIICMVKQCTGD
jgi:N-acetylglutamate synthase-like GNAT family acetyltransferase